MQNNEENNNPDESKKVEENYIDAINPDQLNKVNVETIIL